MVSFLGIFIHLKIKSVNFISHVASGLFSAASVTLKMTLNFPIPDQNLSEYTLEIYKIYSETCLI